MITDSLEPTQKVAIMLLSLDQGLAAEVLGRMPREMVERVTLAIANAGNVTREQQESVLNQFKSEFVSRPLMVILKLFKNTNNGLMPLFKIYQEYIIIHGIIFQEK